MNLSRITGLLPVFLLFALFAAAQAHAAPASPERKVPTNIQSDSMEYNAAAQTVVFSGNVHVTRPDFELWSKTLTVYLKKNPNASADTSGAESMRAGDIDRLVAAGNVRLKSEDKSGECQTLTYYADTEKVVMEGSPVLRDPDSVIRSNVITHYMKTNQSHAGGGRVDATFQAPDKTGKNAGNGDRKQ